MSEREFLFEYRFAGSEWNITIHAASPAEAREKIKAVALAQYRGEIATTFRVPRFLSWLLPTGRNTG